MGDLLDFLNAYRVPSLHVTSFLLLGAIWRWGGAPERWLIGIFIATMVLPTYVIWWFGLGAAEVGPYAPVVMLIDMSAAAMFIGVALKANRNYPLWIAGFQLVAVGAHLVRSIIDTISPLAIAILVIGPAYCQLLLLLAGFARHALRQRRFGPYREWRLKIPTARGLQL